MGEWRLQLEAVALVAAAAALACGGTRRVAGAPAGSAPQTQQPVGESSAQAGPPLPAASTAAAPAPATSTDPGTASTAGSASAGPEAGPDPVVALEGALRPALGDPARAADRKQRFARAVAKISEQLGVPITAEQATRDVPCGGWSGPDCQNLAVGLEMAKASAPVIANFHKKRTAEIATVLAEAVAIHSIWHDAYGYVRQKKKKGPGYTYAGCLFSRCDAADMKNGQVDGILYQVGRLLGTATTPACGPDCTLGDL